VFDQGICFPERVREEEAEGEPPYGRVPVCEMSVLLEASYGRDCDGRCTLRQPCRYDYSTPRRTRRPEASPRKAKYNAPQRNGNRVLL
jgi:hypothetical protein